MKQLSGQDETHLIIKVTIYDVFYIDLQSNHNLTKLLNMKKTFIKFITSRLILLLMMVTVAACGDDVTNNYYQQPETPQPEVPEEEEEEPAPEYQLGEWIQDVHSLSYYGFYYEPAYSFYPGWILQANGVKRAFFDSPFVQEFVTDDLALIIKNPGEGVRITINTDESDINRASSMDYVVKAEDTDEMLTLSLPVKWNEEALLNWHTDRMVKMNWSVQLDGQLVQRYSQTFNCRSLRCFTMATPISKAENLDFVEAIKELGFGSYTVNEDDDLLYIMNIPFLMGYIDEHSPLIEKLKREVIDDGLVSTLSSIGGGDPKFLIECSSYAFSYLMMKHKIKYTVHNASDNQYIRSIDEIFANQQGYCMELAIAFASWCMNQGVTCSLESVPGHMVNRMPIGESLYPADMTVIASSDFDISNFSTPLSPENIEKFQSYYKQWEDYCVQVENEVYIPGRDAGEITYATLIPDGLRPYLPSFNISQNYIQSRVAAPAKEIKPITNRVWKEIALKAIQQDNQ